MRYSIRQNVRGLTSKFRDKREDEAYASSPLKGSDFTEGIALTTFSGQSFCTNSSDLVASMLGDQAYSTIDLVAVDFMRVCEVLGKSGGLF